MELLKVEPHLLAYPATVNSGSIDIKKRTGRLFGVIDRAMQNRNPKRIQYRM
jgi:hypothetical protein